MEMPWVKEVHAIIQVWYHKSKLSADVMHADGRINVVVETGKFKVHLSVSQVDDARNGDF